MIIFNIYLFEKIAFSNEENAMAIKWNNDSVATHQFRVRVHFISGCYAIVYIILVLFIQIHR